MDLVLLTVGVVVVLASAISVFFISLKMMKTESFEDVLAEKTRREQEVERQLGIKTKDVKKELKKKKKEKKVKLLEENEPEEASDEVDEPEPDVKEQSKKSKTLKTTANVDKTQSEEKKAPGKTENKKKGKTAEPVGARGGKARILFEEEEFEIPFILTESKKKKKQNVPELPKKEVPKKEIPKSNVPKVTVQPVQSAPAVALNGPEWTTKTSKGDPQALIKKQADEKIEEVKELRAQLLSANTRYAELRNELMTVRQLQTASDNRAREELADKVREIEALKVRFSQSHMEHLKEVNQLNQQVRSPKVQGQGQGQAVVNGEAQLIKILSEDNRKLKEELAAIKARGPTGPAGGEDLQLKVKFMDDALKQNAVLLNASENARKTAEQKLKQSEDKLSKMDAKLKATEKKAKTNDEEFKNLEASNKSLSAALEAAKTEASNFQEHLSTIQKEEAQAKEMEEKLKSLQSQFQIVEQLIQQKDVELESLRSETKKLTDDANCNLSQNVKENEERNSLIERLNKEIKDREAAQASHEEQLKEEKQLGSKLQADLVHYQTVLAETEKSLNTIQAKVESEEKSWHQKLTDSAEQLKASQEEANRLRNELEKVGNKGEPSLNHVEQSSTDADQPVVNS